MWGALPFHPESFVEADGINNQRVPFPASDGVSIKAGVKIFWMLPAVHIDHAERLRSCFIQDIDRLSFRDINELGAAGSNELPRSARRFAACVGLQQIALTILIERPCPGLKWHFALLRFTWKWRAGKGAAPLTILDDWIG